MSFQQGLSGLAVTSKQLDVIGNNIANANTVGSKVARAEFGDLYAAALGGGGGSNVGIGTSLTAVSQQFTQGNINATGNAMDLSINGAGFFQMQDATGTTLYSRNGQFKVDRDGNIVNNAHLQLMGYPANAEGVIQPGQSRPLKLTTAGIEPKSTDKVSIEMNLDSGDKVTAPAAGTVPQIEFDEPTSYNNATSVTVYDAKGQDVALTYYFQKVATDQWNVFVTANGVPVNGTAADPQPISTTPLRFLADGSAPIDDVSALPLSIAGPLNNANGAAIVTPLNFTLSLQKATQYGSQFGVTDLAQDGYAPGQLSSIAIESDGTVMARYSNGQSKPAGQIELANFRNPQGLQAQGGNVWAASYASGDPILGVPSEGNMGTLQSGALEDANIDLTGELVSLITAQRIYQANAQTIKTQDQVLQTLVNLR